MTDVASSVSIQLNGKSHEVPAGTTLSGLLESLDLVPGMVVVEHNLEIVERDRYGDVTIGRSDRIEIVHFVGGG